jgi:MYXO-CTERM domain-containing protein
VYVMKSIARAHEAITVKRVFGDPYERGGVTVIPAAAIAGTAGGGSGDAPKAGQSGAGGGFGIRARPVGAYVIENGRARWVPATDLTGVILRTQGLAGVLLLALLLLRRRRR